MKRLAAALGALIALTSPASSAMASPVLPQCAVEDGSEMLYSKRYSVCVWDISRDSRYTVSIDRRTETKRGAWLTYTYLDRSWKITEVDREWVEK